MHFKTSEMQSILENPLYADFMESVHPSYTISDHFFPGHKSAKEEYHRTVGEWCKNQFK